MSVRATSWGENPYAFSQSSGGMEGDVTSLSVSGCVAVDESHPFVITIPTRDVGPEAQGSAVCNRSHIQPCSYPNGRCVVPESGGGDSSSSWSDLNDESEEANTMLGVCECAVPFYGPDCSQRASCRYWDVVAERWSTHGCVVANASATETVCHCTHLTDFGAFAEGFVPEMNLINPFDADLLAAFLADPRNLVPLSMVCSLYIAYVVLVYVGYKKDKRERHLAYMSSVVQQVDDLGTYKDDLSKEGRDKFKSELQIELEALKFAELLQRAQREGCDEGELKNKTKADLVALIEQRHLQMLNLVNLASGVTHRKRGRLGPCVPRPRQMIHSQCASRDPFPCAASLYDIWDPHWVKGGEPGEPCARASHSHATASRSLAAARTGRRRAAAGCAPGPGSTCPSSTRWPAAAAAAASGPSGASPCTATTCGSAA